MDQPQTKKQQHKDRKDKGSMEFKRAGKGARAIEKNQERSLTRKKN
jgi:hypothetical protein